MRALLVAVTAGLMTVAAPAVGQNLANGGIQFIQALKEGDESKAYTLLENNNSTLLNFRDDHGMAALHVVTANRNTSWVTFLLARGADANVTNREGDTPLIIASRAGYEDGAAVLLSSGADVNRVNKRGESPLIVAVNQRQPRMVRLLLEVGANPDKRDFAAGYSAREYAKRDTRMSELLRLIETVKPKTHEVFGPTR